MHLQQQGAACSPDLTKLAELNVSQTLLEDYAWEASIGHLQGAGQSTEIDQACRSTMILVLYVFLTCIPAGQRTSQLSQSKTFVAVCVQCAAQLKQHLLQVQGCSYGMKLAERLQ